MAHPLINSVAHWEFDFLDGCGILESVDDELQISREQPRFACYFSQVNKQIQSYRCRYRISVV